MRSPWRPAALVAVLAAAGCRRTADHAPPQPSPPPAAAETPVRSAEPPAVSRIPRTRPDVEEQPGVLVPVETLSRPEPPPALDFGRLPAREGLPKDPIPVPAVRPEAKRSDAERALRKACAFWASIGTRREYPGFGKVIAWGGTYSGDLKLRTGEAGQPLPPDVVLMQRCIGPVGTAFLDAYRATGDPGILDTAREAGNFLLAAQTPFGGWNCECWLGPAHARGIHVYPGIDAWPDSQEERGTDFATFDDTSTNQEAEFLYRLWWVTKEPRFYEGWRRGMDFILLAQKERVGGKGGIPQGFPQGGYHAYATFNDHAMRNCLDSLLRAYRRTGDKRYFDAAVRCGDWIVSVKRPGQGWGLQYDEEGRIQGARKFEPPGLGPADATTDAMEMLKTLYDWTGDPKYVEPIQDAARWLEKVQIAPGRWARFYHPDTNKPWYRTIEGKDLEGPTGAKPGYTWERDWGAAGLKIAQSLKGAGKKDPLPPPPGRGDPSVEAEWLRLDRGERDVSRIVSSQEESGAWRARKGRHKGGYGASEFFGNVSALSQAVIEERRKEAP